MDQHIWHAFYFDTAGAPCRSEVIEAANEEAAAKVAQEHLGDCKHVKLEPPRWQEPKSRDDPRR